MGLDEELETIEDGAETEAEQIDQETELEDVEGFQNDEEFDPSDDETRLFAVLHEHEADDDIVRYIEDEDGDVIGFVLMEDGEEAEYYYVEEDEEEAEEEDNPYDLGITKEGVAEATNDMNAIYKDGIAVAAELKGAFDDIKSALDFTSFLKK